jgi:hypothetical protein
MPGIITAQLDNNLLAYVSGPLIVTPRSAINCLPFSLAARFCFTEFKKIICTGLSCAWHVIRSGKVTVYIPAMNCFKPGPSSSKKPAVWAWNPIKWALRMTRSDRPNRPTVLVVC